VLLRVRVDVRLDLGKWVPLGRLHKLIERLRTVHFVQLVPHKWNIVINEVRHERQMCPSSAIEWLDAHGRFVGDVEPIVVLFMRRHRNNKAMGCSRKRS
jgi:hypothetical protein